MQLLEKRLRPCDTAKDNRSQGRISQRNSSAQLPNVLTGHRQAGCEIFRQDQSVCPINRAEWLTQASFREQAVIKILRCQHDNMEIAGQRTMLEAIVENVQLWAELVLCKDAGTVAVFSNDHRASETARDQQWFVAEVIRRAIAIDSEHSTCASAVAARKNVILNVARFEQLAEQHDKRCFARSSNRNISHADDGLRQSARLQDASIVQTVANLRGGAVNHAERAQAGVTSRASRISSRTFPNVNRVAPCCEPRVSAAR